MSLRTAARACGLLSMTTLITGCPLVVPLPGDVNASRYRTAAAGLRPDDGILVVASREARPQELEQAVISCIHEELAKTSRARRVVAPDDVLRNAFAAQDRERRGGADEELLNDPAFHEHAAQLRLRYSIAVSAEYREDPRTWQAVSGGGVAILTGQKVWYALTGVAVDLTSGQMIGSIQAYTEAKSFGAFWIPVLIVWVPRWIRRGKTCQEFGREAAELLGEGKPLNAEY